MAGVGARSSTRTQAFTHRLSTVPPGVDWLINPDSGGGNYERGYGVALGGSEYLLGGNGHGWPAFVADGDCEFQCGEQDVFSSVVIHLLITPGSDSF